MRLLPTSFSGRLLVLLGAAILVGEILAIAIMVGDRRISETFAFKNRVIEQAVTAYGVVVDFPSGSSPPLMRVSSSGQVFGLMPARPNLSADWFRPNQKLEVQFAKRLVGNGHPVTAVIAGTTLAPIPLPVMLAGRPRAFQDAFGAGRPPGPPPGPTMGIALPGARAFEMRVFRPPPGDVSGRQWPPGFEGERSEFVLAAQLPNGSWLISFARRPPSVWPMVQRASLAAAAVAIVVLAIAAVVAMLMLRPLNRLTTSLAAFGRGEPIPGMALDGPEDVRAAIAAFNTMSANVTRVIAAQRQMLAAVGHDLATPLTTLRLKAEEVGDPALRSRIVENIEEIGTLSEDVLTLARQAGSREPPRIVELSALIDSLCQDLQEVHVKVEFEDCEPVLWCGRSNDLRRALRNLIENAYRYGDIARVRLLQKDSAAFIEIDDDGPGVPDDKLEEILQPFVRLEESRNRHTGGSGLGLAIARTIVDSLGGRLALSNREEGGLRVEIVLPLESEAQDAKKYCNELSQNGLVRQNAK